MLVRGLFLLALLSPVAATPIALAMTVTPTHVELTSAGARSRALITVVNTDTRPLPVEANILRADLDESGAVRTSEGADEFLVMPPQALIPPGATQNFRVQWLGDPMIEKSQSFILYLTQIPVKLPERQSAVQVVMSIGALINVAPPRGAPSLHVVDSGVVTGRQGKRHPTVTVVNTSKVHALLPQSTVRLTAANWSQTVTSATLAERVGVGLVQPGRRRRFVMPVDLPANVTSVQAQIDFRPAR